MLKSTDNRPGTSERVLVQLEDDSLQFAVYRGDGLWRIDVYFHVDAEIKGWLPENNVKILVRGLLNE